MRRKWLRWAVSAAFSLTVIGWAAFALDWRQVTLALSTARWGWILLAMGLVFVTFITRVFRWQALFFPERQPAMSLFSALMIGQAVNYIVPARAGDVTRAVLLNRLSGASTARTLGTVALEKLWDIAMLVLFTVGLGLVFPLPQWLIAPVRSVSIGLSVGAALLAILLWRRNDFLAVMDHWGERFSPDLYRRARKLVENALDGFAGMRHPHPITAAIFWSLMTWVSGALINFAVFRAVNLSLSAVPAILLLIVLQVGVAVPSLPGRIGVFEGLVVVVLALFGVEYDVAFSYGLILHLAVFVPPIALAAVLSFRVGRDGKKLPQKHGDTERNQV